MDEDSEEGEQDGRSDLWAGELAASLLVGGPCSSRVELHMSDSTHNMHDAKKN